jgi:hypothetical protein
MPPVSRRGISFHAWREDAPLRALPGNVDDMTTAP